MGYLELTSLPILAFAAAFALTWKIRDLALRRGVLDVPNARSSHAVPTPRGGGLAFVIVTLGFAALALAFGLIPLPLALATLLGGGIVAAVGVADDVLDLGTRLRLVAHALAALAVIYFLGPLQEIPFFTTAILLGPMAWPFTVFMIIWLINLTNFMDGINGIAGMHALGFCCVAAAAGPGGSAPLALVLGGGVMGFLAWNFPRGLIFMGDAGSGFLGLLAAILVLGGAGWQAANAAAVLIMLAPFITDATLTLLLRLSRRERVFQAHRSHLYQRLSRIAGSHAPVTLGFAAFLAIGMGPLALWAAGAFGPAAPGTPLMLAYLGCILGWMATLRPTLSADPAA